MPAQPHNIPVSGQMCIRDREYYAHSSMYVLSSRWEGFGLVMIEAMAHGLPVIASDLPITRELLKDKDMAVLFETGNIAQLAGCMSYMADRTDCWVSEAGSIFLVFFTRFLK